MMDAFLKIEKKYCECNMGTSTMKKRGLCKDGDTGKQQPIQRNDRRS